MCFKKTSLCTPFSHPWPLATTNLFSIVMVLPFGKSHRIKEHAISSVASWTQRKAFANHVSCYVHRQTIPFNTCEICGDFPSFIPDAAKFVFLFARLPFITFVDCFKETAISFIDSSIFLFSVSLISPRLYFLPFSCFEVIFVLCCTYDTGYKHILLLVSWGRS